MINLPFAYLSHLSKEISNGRALHALAVANEYLPTPHPLRRALLQKALQHNPLLADTATFSMLSEGAKFNDLSREAQSAVQAERSPRLTAERRRYLFNGDSRRAERSSVSERRGEPTTRTRRIAVSELVRARKLVKI